MARTHPWILVLCLVGITGACGTATAPDLPPPTVAPPFSPNFGATALPVNAAGVTRDPRICCAGDRISGAWETDTDPERVYFNYSTDGGVTWQENDTRLDVGSDDVRSTDVTICCDG